MLRRLLIAFICLTFSGLHSQNIKISGKVLDSKTEAALPFANLIMVDRPMGTSANAEGIFAFSISDSLRQEKVRITYVGYESEIWKIEDLPNAKIRLKPLTEDLSEIRIYQPKESKSKILRPSGGKTMGMGNLNGGQYPSTMATWFPKPDKFDEAAFIESIQVFFFTIENDMKLRPKFRLHIYDVTEDGKPGNDLADDIILEKKEGNDRITINLLDRKIRIPENGFFVGVEHLFIPQNRFYEEKDIIINDTLVAENYRHEQYGPIFKCKVVKEEENKTWFYGPQGWEHISQMMFTHKVFDSGTLKPIFKIKITD